MLRYRRTTKNRLPIPPEHSIELTYALEIFVVFRGRSEEYIDQSPAGLSEQTCWLVHRFDELKKDFLHLGNDINVINRVNRPSLAFLKLVHRL